MPRRLEVRDDGSTRLEVTPDGLPLAARESREVNVGADTYAAVRRGCGYRIVGGFYWEFCAARTESAVARRGDAGIADYILATPIPIDAEALGLTPVAVKPIERNGVTHVLDWVGAQHYPTVDGFLTEIRRLGVSRRMPQNFPWVRLSGRSLLLLIHPHGCGENQPGIIARVPCSNIALVIGDYSVGYVEPVRRARNAVDAQLRGTGISLMTATV